MDRLLFLLAFLPLLGLAQDVETDTALIEQLQSDSSLERTKASRHIYGSGRENPELYRAVARAIDLHGADLSKDSPRDMQQEIAWHAKALGSSGDSSYMSLLIKLGDSPSRTVAKHAKEARAMLKRSSTTGLPYVAYDSVRVISEAQAERCEFIRQQDCATHRSLSKCVDSHKNMASRIGADSIVVLHDSDSAGPVRIYRAKMTASYYKCRNQQVSSEVPVSGQATETELPDYIAELRALAALRDEGVITEEEFQARKAELLSEQ